MTPLAAAVSTHVVELTIAQIRESGQHLFEQHYAEVAQDKQVPLEPDWPAYDALESAGLVLCLGAYVCGELVGYSLNFIQPRHLHYASLCYAQNDIFFVTKSHRGKQCGATETIGDQLRAATKRIAKQRGAAKVLWHAKEGSAMARWLASQGCRVADIVFSEDL